MANYNTFLVTTTKGKPLLVTSSGKKAAAMLQPGVRVEVWNENAKREIVYARTRWEMGKYIEAERAYIGRKQALAERKNARRKAHRRTKHEHRDFEN